MHKSIVADHVSRMLLDVDYDNFKDACPDDRHLPYLRIWQVMHQLQADSLPRPKRRRRKKASVRPPDSAPDRIYFDWLLSKR